MEVLCAGGTVLAQADTDTKAQHQASEVEMYKTENSEPSVSVDMSSNPPRILLEVQLSLLLTSTLILWVSFGASPAILVSLMR